MLECDVCTFLAESRKHVKMYQINVWIQVQQFLLGSGSISFETIALSFTPIRGCLRANLSQIGAQVQFFSKPRKHVQVFSRRLNVKNIAQCTCIAMQVFNIIRSSYQQYVTRVNSSTCVKTRARLPEIIAQCVNTP